MKVEGTTFVASSGMTPTALSLDLSQQLSMGMAWLSVLTQEKWFDSTYDMDTRKTYKFTLDFCRFPALHSSQLFLLLK
jgi:hypothetical protein